MLVRTIVITFAAFVAASPAFAQQAPEPPQQARAVATEPAETEPDEPAASRDDVYVRAARPLPVQRVEGATTFDERQRHQQEARCVLHAQGAVDPTELDFGPPEDLCRSR